MTATAQDAGSPIARFEIARFEVEGNSLLPPDEVRNIVAPHAGKNRNFGDVQRALEALEAAYHKRGFSVVQVMLPEQELNQGVVRLRVIETRIGKVRVEGNRHVDEANIRRSLPALQEGETPNIPQISKNLRLANENPAKKTTLQLKGSDKEGEVEANLRVEDDKPWTLGANVDNTGNASTGKHRVGVQYQHANLFGLDHVLSLQYSTTAEKPSQVGIYSVGYHAPLYRLGDSIDLFASYSDVDSGTVATGAALIDLAKITGRGASFGLRYNQNLGRKKDYESKLIYGFDYKAYQSNVQLSSSTVTLVTPPLSSDVTVHPLSLTYAGSWSLSSGELSYYLSAMHNIPGGSKGEDAAFRAVRASAPAAYKLLRYGANFSHGFANGWQLRFAMNGQYTNDSLVPGEQFGVGGSTAVRGYQEREVADDVGYSALAEIYTPNLCADSAIGLAQCRLLAFLEHGHVERNNPGLGEIASSSIGSVGLGLRLAAHKYFNMQMDFGHALRAGPTTAKGDHRVHFRVNFLY